MRQKLVPRTVRRPSPTPAVMVRLRSTNTKKIQFTQRLPLGSELHMGKERCCLRGLDHLHGPTFHSICGNLMIYKPSLTNDRLMFEHDESLRADLLLINFPASYENGKLEHFLHRWMKNREHNNFWLTMFPEKRYFQETTSTTEVAIHTNLFTDLYASIGTSSSRTGGWVLQINQVLAAEHASGHRPYGQNLQSGSFAGASGQRDMSKIICYFCKKPEDHAKGILWSKGIGKDRRVGKLSFLEKLRLPQSFAFFAVSGVVSSTPLFLLCCGIVD
uniref:Uncharacterized protein n=1 Tax=Acer yangbiense TaxID=1000413 RepID=A0A5C7GPH4_9ROSI